MCNSDFTLAHSRTEGEAEVILQKYDADNSGALDIMEYIGVFAE